MENTGQLAEIKTKLENGEPVSRVSVREFLAWFGAQRRGVWIVSRIRDALSEVGVETEPDFESAYIDSTIGFTLPATVEVDAEEASASGIPSFSNEAEYVGKGPMLAKHFTKTLHQGL